MTWPKVSTCRLLELVRSSTSRAWGHRSLWDMGKIIVLRFALKYILVDGIQWHAHELQAGMA